MSYERSCQFTAAYIAAFWLYVAGALVGLWGCTMAPTDDDNPDAVTCEDLERRLQVLEGGKTSGTFTIEAEGWLLEPEWSSLSAELVIDDPLRPAGVSMGQWWVKLMATVVRIGSDGNLIQLVYPLFVPHPVLGGPVDVYVGSDVYPGELACTTGGVCTLTTAFAGMTRFRARYKIPHLPFSQPAFISPEEWE